MTVSQQCQEINAGRTILGFICMLEDLLKNNPEISCSHFLWLSLLSLVILQSSHLLIFFKKGYPLPLYLYFVAGLANRLVLSVIYQLQFCVRKSGYI